MQTEKKSMPEKRGQRSRFRRARGWPLFWCLFIGIGAVGGATLMLIDPTGRLMGMDVLLPCFQVLPLAEWLYQDYVFPGIALLLVNGLPNLIAALLLLREKRLGIVLGGVFGVTLMLWICIQFVIFPLNFMSTSYFLFGLAQACTGYAAWVFRAQEQFRFDPAAYPRVGTNGRELVVYFSRMGYTRKVAWETANRTGAVIRELRTPERTEGTLGFWWCGRFGLHRMPMPLEKLDVDVGRFDHVTIVTPIWVFSLCAPVRQFCREAAGKLKSVDYVLVHHMKCRFEGVAGEMDALLHQRRHNLTSVCCRRGHFWTVPGRAGK